MATRDSEINDTGEVERSRSRVSEKTLTELKEKGYAVIEDVLTQDECDLYQKQFQGWLAQFEDEFPVNRRSVIQHYGVGHLEPCWHARLKAKRAFADVWGTDKLLTSMDGVALHKPPEKDDHVFAVAGQNWFHLDQGSSNSGLHSYQGGVYLEEASELDWCFRVVENSHKFHDLFFETFPDTASKTRKREFYPLEDDELQWYKSQGCTEKKVPVPKGGLVLWDSRTLHDNCRPEKGRPHPERWRYVVFVCMTPAFWASEEDYTKKREIFENRMLTSHQPSRYFRVFPRSNSAPQRVKGIVGATLGPFPEVSKSQEAKLLVGLDRYDFDDGKPNGPDLPASKLQERKPYTHHKRK